MSKIYVRSKALLEYSAWQSRTPHRQGLRGLLARTGDSGARGAGDTVRTRGVEWRLGKVDLQSWFAVAGRVLN